MAGVAQLLFEHGANILHAEQHRDSGPGQFHQRVEFETDPACDTDTMHAEFLEMAEAFGMRWEHYDAATRVRLAIFASHTAHCLHDLLWRHRSGELPCDIPLVVSNHDKLRDVAALYGAAFHAIPVTPKTKPAAEARQLALLAEHRVDLIVSADYRQIYSPDFVARWPNRIINIHQSFLPAFPGENAYGKAYERGVKLIGATSHYITAELDAGPIIAQDVVHVSHRHTPEDLKRLGRDVERRVLAAAVLAHVQRRVLVTGAKTVVFS